MQTQRLWWLLVVVLLSSSVPASAEWFFDVHIGGMLPQDADVSGRITGPGLSLSGTGTVELDPGFIFGLRFGRWFQSLPWVGLALDAGAGFIAEPELILAPISLLGMARTELFPGSRMPLEPYVGLGPSLVVASGRNGESVTTTTVGLDVRAGLL